MRAMFVVYLVLIMTGILFFIDHRPDSQLMRRFLRDNSLSIVFLLLFLAALTGQAFAGHADFNEDADPRTASPRSRCRATSSRPTSGTP